MSTIRNRRIPLDKRKRTEISCDRCKGRKQKCHKPLGKGTCRYCHDRGFECVVTQIRKPRAPPGSAASVDGVGMRLALLESLVKGLIPEADLSGNDEMRDLGRSLGILLPAQDKGTSEEEKQSPSQNDERLLQDGQGRIQYIGPGSSYFFMMKLRNMIGYNGSNQESQLCLTLGDRNPADNEQISDLEGVAATTNTPIQHEHTSPKDIAPDMRDGIANTLVDTFFENVHADFPILHEASFRETYERWSTSSGTIERTWLCSLLCMFILARRVATITIPPEQEERWWYQAQTLLPSVLFTSSVSAVQALMLASLHLHNTRNRDACWTLTGAAVRISFAIGLHRDGIGNLQTPLMREMRKRVWWTLYSFEQMQVSSHDRPSAIENAICSVGTPKVSILDTGLPPDYMSWSNRLVVILGSTCRALRTIRIIPTEDAPIGPLSLAAGLLRDLDRWKSTLPPHLSIDAINVLPPTYQRPLLLLHLQYNYVVSLVSRSALLSRVATFSTKPGDAPPEATLSMANVCIASGRTSCDLVQKLDTIGRFNATVWWDIYYTYSSALILVLTTICDTMAGDNEAATRSKKYLAECAKLATKHMRNPMMPATMRRWATTIIELHAMATTFVGRFEEQHNAPNAIGTSPEDQIATQPSEDFSALSVNDLPDNVSMMSYSGGPLPSTTPPRMMISGARNTFGPWTQFQFLDPEAAPFWSDVHWGDFGDMLLGE